MCVFGAIASNDGITLLFFSHFTLWMSLSCPHWRSRVYFSFSLCNSSPFWGKKIMVGLKFWGMGKSFMLNYGYWIGNFEIGLFFCSTRKQYPFIAVRNHGHVNKALLLLALRDIQINSSNKLTLSQNTYVSF